MLGSRHRQIHFVGKNAEEEEEEEFDCRPFSKDFLAQKANEKLEKLSTCFSQFCFVLAFLVIIQDQGTTRVHFLYDHIRAQALQ